jgi:hypothetical protein
MGHGQAHASHDSRGFAWERVNSRIEHWWTRGLTVFYMENERLALVHYCDFGIGRTWSLDL